MTQTNENAVLGVINAPATTISEIRNAISAGKDVITHPSTISIPGWSGSGYIIFDPATGDGSYKIAGGANGGWEQNSPFPFVQAILGISDATAGEVQNAAPVTQTHTDWSCFTSYVLMASPAIIFLAVLAAGFALKFPGPWALLALVLTAIFVVWFLIQWEEACQVPIVNSEGNQ